MRRMFGRAWRKWLRFAEIFGTFQMVVANLRHVPDGCRSVTDILATGAADRYPAEDFDEGLKRSPLFQGPLVPAPACSECARGHAAAVLEAHD